MTKTRPSALVALGANQTSEVGDPTQTLMVAIKTMQSEGLEPCAVSRFYATPSFPHGASPDYVNAVVGIGRDLSASDILAVLHRIEQRFGRKRLERWGMRTLDLDLLAVADRVLPDLATFKTWQELAPDDQVNRTPEQLILPHPRLQDRAFVLVPMADIAPDWVHPVLDQSVAAMCAQLPRSDREAVRAI